MSQVLSSPNQELLKVIIEKRLANVADVEPNLRDRLQIDKLGKRKNYYLVRELTK